MEVGRQITFWFIVCYCVNIIYTEERVDNASTTPPSEESSNRSELETGNLSGIIVAHKNGTKLKLKINTKVFWNNNKSRDSMTCAVPAIEKKGVKGDKGDNGTPGIEGKMGEKGSTGNDGLNGSKGDIGQQGLKGEMGGKGDKGDNGTPGIEGKMGEKGSTGNDGLNGSKGDIGQQGLKGEMGEKGDKGDNGTPGIEGKMGERGSIGMRGLQGEKGEKGKCEDSGDGRTKANYGQKENPAYSCFDIPDDGLYYINEARSFEVYCDNYKTYISNKPITNNFINLEKNKEVWLSSKKLDLNQFYGKPIPNLSYLMSTNMSFNLTLTYSDEVEILQILSWNGITQSMPLSNGCKSIKQKNYLEITCSPPNYLPMDFYIKAQKEEVSIVLKRLYFK